MVTVDGSINTGGLYAFAIVGLASTLGGITLIDSDWTFVASASSGNWNYIFRYQPSSVRTISTFNNSFRRIFNFRLGSIPEETRIHWVNGPLNSSDNSYDGNPTLVNTFTGVTYNNEYSVEDFKDTIEITAVSTSTISPPTTVILYKGLTTTNATSLTA